MKTIDTNTLVTATGGFGPPPCFPGYGPYAAAFGPGFAPAYRPMAAARWAYASGYSYGYAPRWAPGPRWAY